jgi:hypothetical protein
MNDLLRSDWADIFFGLIFFPLIFLLSVEL